MLHASHDAGVRRATLTYHLRFSEWRLNPPYELDQQGLGVRPGSHGRQAFGRGHGVKGLDRYAAAKPPLTPWLRPKKNVHAIQAGPSILQGNGGEGVDLSMSSIPLTRPRKRGQPRIKSGAGSLCEAKLLHRSASVSAGKPLVWLWFRSPHLRLSGRE